MFGAITNRIKAFMTPVSIESVTGEIVRALQGETTYDVSDDDNDATLKSHFRDAGNMWAHQDRMVRMDAEEKADFEVRNSGHLTGAKKTYANDVIGKYGARIQVIATEEFPFDEDTAEEYSRKFHRWLDDVRATRKAKQMLKVEMPRGEAICFVHPINQPEAAKNFRNPVKVGVRVSDTRRLDAHRVPDFVDVLEEKDEDGFIDGIRYDEYDNPAEYRFNKARLVPNKDGFLHPVDNDDDFETVSADRVFHFFQHEYAEQRRGFTGLASVLHPAALARQGATSIVKAIRNVARLFGWIEQPNLPITEAKEDGTKKTTYKAKRPGSTVKIADGMMKVLGSGQKIQVTDPKHPNSNTESFLSFLWGWVGRALSLPMFLITGDFSKTNFTSGRMGLQGWDAQVDDVRAEFELGYYDMLHRHWFEVAIRTRGYFSGALLNVLARASTGEAIYPPEPDHKWYWSQREAISPLIEARGKQICLRIGTKTHADYVTDGDIESKWRCEASLYGITIEQLRRIKLASVHDLDPEKLNQLLEEDVALTQAADSDEADDETTRALEGVMSV